MLVFERVLNAFWVAFGAQNGAQNRPQDGQKGVLEPTSEKHQKMIGNSIPETLKNHLKNLSNLYVIVLQIHTAKFGIFEKKNMNH